MAEMEIVEEQKEIPRKSEEVCGSFPFSWLAELMEEFEKTRKMTADQKMKKIFSKKFTSAFVGKPEESIYPLISLLLPLYDLDRGRYNLKEKKIANTYINAMGINPTSKGALALLNFKDIKKVEDATGDGSISGNLGAVLCAVLKDRAEPHAPSGDLKYVNELLDRLARAENETIKTDVIKIIFKRFSRFEQKWLIRIVLGGELKIGLTKDVLLKKLGKGMVERFDSCMNLRTVVDEFDPSIGAVVTSSSIGVKPMSNFAPMLADGVFKAAGHTGQGLVAAVEKYMDKEGFFMDEKMDGERLQVHVDHGEIRMWSRKGKEYTNLYGSIADVVRRSLKDGITTCIFDGEVLSWDNRKADGEGEIEPFGSVKTVAKQENGRRDSQHHHNHSQPMDVASSSSSSGEDGADRWLIYVVFDILYIGGIHAKDIVTKAGGLGFEGSDDVGSICNLPLFVRRKILERVIIQQPKRFVIVPSEYVPPSSQFGDIESRKYRIEIFFNSICFEVNGLVTKGGEGIVAKKETSLYELNSRTGGWVKMKPEYGGQVPELDLIVIGAHYGGGKGYRARGISKFTLGVSDGEDPITGRVRYRTVIRVGTGYSFDELEHIRKLIDPALGGVGVPWEKKNLPKELADWNVPNNEDKPNFYLPPEKSFLMQIKCAELTKCMHKTFSAEITCRFPRVQRIRYDDKEIESVLTMEDLRAMMAGNGFRNDAAHVKKHPSRFPKKKTGAASSSSLYRSTLGTVDNSLTVSHDMARSDISRQGIFAPNTYNVEDGTTFKVLNPVTNATIKSYTKEDIQKMISTHGGTISANAINKGGDQPVKTLVVVGNKPLNVRHLMEIGEYDLLDFRYILDCVNNKCQRPPTSLEYVSMSRATRKRFGRELDALDLSFYEEIELKDVNRLFDTLEQRIDRLRKEISPSLLVTSSKGASKPPAKKTKTEVAEMTEPFTRGEIKAKKRMIKKYDKTKKMSDWRQIYESLLYEEREVLDDPETRLYRNNVVIYLDIYEDIEHGNGLVISHLLMALGARMSLRGATISSVLDQTVTHIVIDPSTLNLDPYRASVIHARIFALQKAVEDENGMEGDVPRPAARYIPHVVSSAWAERALIWADQPTSQPVHEDKKVQEEQAGGEKGVIWGEGSEEEDWVEVSREEIVHLTNYFAAMDI